MHRHDPPPPEGYRRASKPDRVPFTVVTVRAGEFAEPEWVRRLLREWRRLRGRFAR